MNPEEAAERRLGHSGACLGSSSLFFELRGRRFAKNQCVVVGGEMVWYGDLDLDGGAREKVQALADDLGEEVRLYPESWLIHPSRGWTMDERRRLEPNEVFAPREKG